MRRNRMIQDIVSGGNTRQRWVSLAADEDLRKQELTMLQKAEEEQVGGEGVGSLQAGVTGCLHILICRLLLMFET
jgi:hypothetical protein